MTSIRMTLNADEQSLLTRVLESALDEAQQEMHHQHVSPTFRENRLTEARLLQQMLKQVQHGHLSE